MMKHWKYDLKSSLVVFLVALPLCLGIALACEAPLSAGLIAGIVGGIVVGFFSDSNVSVSGPAAGLTVIVLAAIKDFGDFNIFTLCVFISGIFQIIFSLVKGGNIGNYFPSSVIKGMLAAIGLILILKQFPHAIGYDADFMGDESYVQVDGQNTFSELFVAIEKTHMGAVIVALFAFMIMIFWDKKAKKGSTFFQLIPGPLVAVVFSVIINEIFKVAFTNLIIEEQHLVQLPFQGGWHDVISVVQMPNWNHLSNTKVYSTALVIAIVGSIESLLSIDAADKIDTEGRVTSKNRELLAQGLGNSLSGLVGGLPLTAVIVRTSANASAGAKTKLSAILHGVWLILCVVAIPTVLNLIPLSCLAAMLILVGYKLTNPTVIKEMYCKGHNQFIPFIATIIAILFTDLLIGIMIGMAVGFFYVFRSNVHKSIVMVNEGNHFLIKFYKDVSFLQKSILLNMFEQIPENAVVSIDGSNNVFVDNDIQEVILDFIKRSSFKNIKIELKKSKLAISPLFKD